MLRLWPFRPLRKKPKKASNHIQASPPMVLALGFLGLIALGTVLFKMPFAAQSSIGWFEAFFTATSAVTITGLSIINPATDLTLSGQILLTILVQIGGLGFVTFAVLAAITLGKRISLQQQALALEAFNQTSVTRIKQTAFSVLKIAFTIQAIAISFLSVWWGPHMGYKEAAYQAYFHVTMSFNNAGMSLFDSSLMGFVHDPISIFALSLMIALGGLGFPVIMNILRKKHWTLLSPYSKAIILGTLCLNIFGFLAIWAFEHNNINTIANLSTIEQISASWFQIISSRTAGLLTMEPSQMKDSSILLMMAYMFIGGGSLSTASGIKLGTFIVLLAALFSYLRHRQEVVLMGRTVSAETVQKSLSLVLVTTALFFFGLLAVTIFENLEFKSVIFEVMSAITTTGMSFGITDQLSRPSQFILTLLMFAGRLGPLTLVYTLATRRRSRIRYPEAHFQVG